MCDDDTLDPAVHLPEVKRLVSEAFDRLLAVDHLLVSGLPIDPEDIEGFEVALTAAIAIDDRAEDLRHEISAVLDALKRRLDTEDWQVVLTLETAQNERSLVLARVAWTLGRRTRRERQGLTGISESRE